MKGCVQLFNREAERITGYAFDEVQGNHFAETLVVDPQSCGFLGAWQQATVAPAQDGAVVLVGCVLRTRSGRRRQVRGTLSRAQLEGEQGSMVFLVGRDVTDENLMAARARRTEKLAAVGTLAAGLAHEIRNPLNGARLHLTILRRQVKAAGGDIEATEAIDVVDGEIQRLSLLVTDFLNYAQPRELARTNTSLNNLCHHCGEMVRGSAAEANVTLDVQVPLTELSAVVDRAKIEQVLLNLLDNAIAAAPDKGGKVVLRAYREPDVAVIEVIDNGGGFDEPGAPIFDAFYSTKSNGTGLGLAIAHRIVTDHGGTLTVTSEPGDTRFVTLLPLDTPSPPPTLGECMALDENKGKQL
ncbi:MAG TPA: PAS domain S-box protein, partial [Sorangium sp.]|nr:PAS domain S-box protein [Sorangium sp.]